MSGGGTLLLALLGGAVKGSCAVGVAAALCALLRRGVPSLRASLWLLAILSFPVCVLLAALPLSVVQVGGRLGAAAATAVEAVSRGVAAAPADPGAALDVAGRTPLWPALFATLWLAGSVVGLGRLVRATVLVRSRLAGARRVRGAQGLRAVECAAACLPGRSVRLLASSDCAVPFTVGLLRPAVVLPARLLAGPEPELLPVLMHELAHAGRCDYLTRRLAYLASCLFWFLPLPWLALRRLHEEQERACDEAVVAWGIAPPDYARTLVEAMRSAPPAWAPGFGAPTRSLERRIKNVLSLPSRRSIAMSRAHRAIGLLVASLLVPLALVRCVGAPAVPPEADTPLGMTLAWPIAGKDGYIAANFGPSMDPLAPGTWFLHKGMDIAWDLGSPVLAAAEGEVVLVENDPAAEYGRNVIIDHWNGYATRYAHLQTILVKTGQKVTRGQQIGTLGSTGVSSPNYHLHFELIQDGQVIDPRPYLDAGAAAGE